VHISTKLNQFAIEMCVVCIELFSNQTKFPIIIIWHSASCIFYSYLRFSDILS